MYVDCQRIHQVFNNLVSNAVKYTEPGGSVSIRLQEQEDSILVAIEDTGIGIPPELLASVFNKFYQVSRKAGPGYHGCGLGLAICKELVAAHSGRIWVESQVGQGSKFFVTLPKTEPILLLRKHVSGLIDHTRVRGGGFAVMRASIEYTAPLSPQLTRAASTVIGDSLCIKREVVCGAGDMTIRTGENELMVVLAENDDSFLRSVHQRLQKIIAATVEKNSFSKLAIQPITNFVVYPRDGADTDQLLNALKKTASRAIDNGNQQRKI